MRLTPKTRRLVLLAPNKDRVPSSFSNASFDEGRHGSLLAETQRLRGRIYLEDGAIEASQLTSDGRHCVPNDDNSWHLLDLDANGNVCGCSRYFVHDNTVPFSQLGVRKAALAQTDRWGQKLRWAIEADLELARRRDLDYAEVGCWALREDLRGSTEAIRIALGTYGLARSLGGCIGVTAATVRHCSSSILRRIGGRALEAGGTLLPSYHDPNYKCEMTILRFDSSRPNPRYEPWIEHIREQLRTALVICRTAQRQYRRNGTVRSSVEAVTQTHSLLNLESMTARSPSWTEDFATANVQQERARR